ncbi:MAG: 4-hydroxy-tetrahydrodipicolinate synthase [Clostridiales bacterium]|mgnify:CR=1 FL=1|uniref:4-hydroxy-tetrahydrodipicolinate synthase n=1 Tax=Clostridium sp. N3C TaxID=1776758 RepID=UPI00092E0E29|nr:4-hydroxy-tetrahydrodipicolinate synthase [Clostridium sp. N3C]NLZ49659.1 4-hydroxy-tetrahydrodipicolinate synthase [Clostridiales bacterium]SCN22771.1 4-hydroxy-tetrahydrodipicolinate synthase [Clostridium sp. N3C]
MKIEGIFLPIITPFKDDKIDYESYEKMINYYINKGVSGIIPLGTTGESPTVSSDEYKEIVEKTIEYCNNRVPIYIGLGGNDTKKVLKELNYYSKYKIDGILSVAPYYNRPSQEGIYQHYKNLSESTDLNIIIYNIPYRTGVNIQNETIYRLAELKNIVGLKDSCGDIKQTTSLLLNPPADFSILTGEDALFYTTLTLGGNGGILASAHIKTEVFIEVYKNIKNNNHKLALENWKKLYPIIPLLFHEPNPAPIKYCLFKLGLIKSSQVRLPLTDISDNLKASLDKVLF